MFLSDILAVDARSKPQKKHSVSHASVWCGNGICINHAQDLRAEVQRNLEMDVVVDVDLCVLYCGD